MQDEMTFFYKEGNNETIKSPASFKRHLDSLRNPLQPPRLDFLDEDSSSEIGEIKIDLTVPRNNEDEMVFNYSSQESLEI